jgi:phage-related protein
VDYRIEYHSESVEEEVLALPDTLSARYVVLTRRMTAVGANLGLPHTDSLGEGLFSLRLKGADGIARVFFCTLIGRRIIMLPTFIKKSQKTPLRELEIARKRMKEVKKCEPMIKLFQSCSTGLA